MKKSMPDANLNGGYECLRGGANDGGNDVPGFTEPDKHWMELQTFLKYVYVFFSLL